MIYKLIKSTDRIRAENREVRFLIQAVLIVFLLFPPYKIFDWILTKVYHHNVLLSGWDFYWETSEEYYSLNDKFRQWLSENRISYHQTARDIKRGNIRFYFRKECDMMAFKLRWI